MSTDALNIFNDSNLSLVKSFENHLFIGNDSGMIKVINLHKKKDEPEILEVCENLTNFTIRHNLLAVINSDGEFIIYKINDKFSNIEANLKCFRSELSLRDLIFLDNQNILLGGDNNELILVKLNRLIASNESRQYHWTNETFDEENNIKKIQISDQIRSLNYNEKEKLLIISLSSGDVEFYDYDKHNIEKPFKFKKNLHDYFNKYIFLPGNDSETINGLDNLALNNLCWNSDNKLAISNKAKDIEIFDNINDLMENKIAFLKLTGEHSNELIEIKFCEFNPNYLASIDFDNKLIIWDVNKKVPVFQEKLSSSFEDSHLKNISWSLLNNRIIVNVGTTSGDVFSVELKELKDLNNENNENMENNIEEDEEEEDNFGLSDDDDLLSSPVLNNEGKSMIISHNKRSRNDFESDDEINLSDFDENNNSEDVIDENFKLNKSIPRYDFKPFSIGCSPWNGNKRYLTINEIGYVIAEKDIEDSNLQTINVHFHNDLSTNYYFMDSVGFDLCYLNEEGILLANSAFIDNNNVDLFSTTFNTISQYKQARVYFRTHKSDSDSWDKILPIKNYFPSNKSKNHQVNEFITNINLTKRFIFIFSNLGHIRILSKFGLLTKIEKSLPILASISNSKILFNISSNLLGTEFYFSIRDLITNNQQNYLIKNQLLPIDYLNKDYFNDEENFDELLNKFENYEKRNMQDDINMNHRKKSKEILNDLVFKPPKYLLKGLFFNNYGDPCIVDNNNFLYILTKWRKNNQGILVPLFNINEILLTKPNLNYIPISLIDDDFQISFFRSINNPKDLKEFLYPFPFPEPTDIEIKIPLSINVNIKAIKEIQKEKELENKLNNDNFIDYEDEDDDNLLNDEVEESEDEEINQEIQKEIELEEGFVRSKLLGDLINESIDNHNSFEKIIKNKFKKYKKAKIIFEENNNDDDYFLNDLDLNLSDNEIENDGDDLKLLNNKIDINATLDRLQELNSSYDKSLLKIYSEFCTNSQILKATNLLKELKQDRALIAASRIAERLELGDLVAKISEEREKRMEFV